MVRVLLHIFKISLYYVHQPISDLQWKSANLAPWVCGQAKPVKSRRKLWDEVRQAVENRFD